MTAWEVTEDDLRTVLYEHRAEHKIIFTDKQISEIHDNLDHEKIIWNAMQHTGMTRQIKSMLSDIEDQLMESGKIPKNAKLF